MSQLQASTSAPSGARAPLLPTPPVIHRPSPKEGQAIYAMNKSLLNFWLRAEVIKIKRTENFQRGEDEPKFHDEYVVQYEPTNRKGKPVEPRGVMKEGAVRFVRQLTMKEMAYSYPCPFVIPVGLRVIAEFRSELTLEHTEGNFYAGIVAERPKSTTKDRYFIFFDDGSAQYVYPEKVFLVCQTSKKVWSDVHPNSVYFIKKYITSYPHWPMVPLKEGSLLPVEWNGNWFIARVVEVDCALAKVQFENDGRIEWIYRGSARFHPINKSNSDQEASNSATSPDVPLGYQGSIKKVKVPQLKPRPKDFKAHRCDPDCVIPCVPNSELNKLSPLAIPLFLGWTREVDESLPNAVYYQTPCGIKLTDYIQLKMYLQETQSNLTVDFFYFGTDVNVLDEFVPAHVLVKVDDISQSKEVRPIQGVNSIDHSSLPNFEYISKSIPSPEVEINTNEEYLMCCTCADNCQAKSSCNCWNLTLENEEKISYKNRRLEQCVLEGVYECNKRCPCNMTCENRVVQAGMRWPLQIFKTTNKGWGLRALHDIPKGTYLCTYTGEILTDDAAEQSAKIFGSVYMADLNYIQINTENKTQFNVWKFLGVRDKESYVVDARLKGNASRFINHSCDPNVRVQNVFIDTHDVRFPEVAFFTTCLVKAGSELVFDYRYKVGSNPGMTVYCSCEKLACRGRLL